jgi:hypothetical protein
MKQKKQTKDNFTEQKKKITDAQKDFNKLLKNIEPYLKKSESMTLTGKNNWVQSSKLLSNSNF